jgi:D-lactate dehydrogenase
MNAMPGSFERQHAKSAAPASGRQNFINQLKSIVGAKHVLTGENRTRRHRTGYRFGSGKAAAVVRPASLLEQWRVLKACVHANKIVIMQAANTGLTGGSTPDRDDYDRDIIIISTLRMKKLSLVEVATPTIDAVLALVQERGRQAGLYGNDTQR